MSVFSERLTLTRKSLKLTQQDVAEKFQLTRSAYSAWESGRNEPPFSFVRDFCRSTGISADFLLGISDTPSTSTRSSPETTLTSVTMKANAKIESNPFSNLLDDQRVHVMSLIKAYEEINVANGTFDIPSQQEA